LLEILWWLGGRVRHNGITFRHDFWHVLWALNASMIGVMFLTHPQHNEKRGVLIHTFLGLSMAWAAMFLMVSKIKGFPPNLEEDFTIVMAGSAQLIASSLLVAFRESPETLHHGIDIRCHGAWPLTVAGYVLAFLSVGVIVLHVIRGRYPSCFNKYCVGSFDGLVSCMDACCTASARCTMVCEGCLGSLRRRCCFCCLSNADQQGYEHVGREKKTQMFGIDDLELEDIDDDDDDDGDEDEPTVPHPKHNAAAADATSDDADGAATSGDDLRNSIEEKDLEDEPRQPAGLVLE